MSHEKSKIRKLEEELTMKLYTTLLESKLNTVENLGCLVAVQNMYMSQSFGDFYVIKLMEMMQDGAKKSTQSSCDDTDGPATVNRKEEDMP